MSDQTGEGPLSIMAREERRRGGHVDIGVFVGRRPGARGKAGTITLRIDEWDAMRERASLLAIEIGEPLRPGAHTSIWGQG